MTELMTIAITVGPSPQPEKGTRHFGVATNYKYNETHKRDCINVFSGRFSDTWEATGYSLPNKNGYMLTTFTGDKIKVICPCPRTEQNYTEVDGCVNAAMNEWYDKDKN